VREGWGDEVTIARLASRPPAPGGMDERLRPYIASGGSPEFLDVSDRLRHLNEAWS